MFTRQSASRGSRLSDRDPIEYRWLWQGVDKFINTEATHKKMFPHGRLKWKRTLPCSKFRVEVIDRSVSRNIDTESRHPRLSSAWNYYIHLYRELVSSLRTPQSGGINSKSGFWLTIILLHNNKRFDKTRWKFTQGFWMTRVKKKGDIHNPNSIECRLASSDWPNFV